MTGAAIVVLALNRRRAYAVVDSSFINIVDELISVISYEWRHSSIAVMSFLFMAIEPINDINEKQPNKLYCYIHI